MKIPLSESDFLLLLKRYMKDGYLVNYVAFLKHIDNITDYLKCHNLLDNSGVRKNLLDYQEQLFQFVAFSGCYSRFSWSSCGFGTITAASR